MIVKYREHFLGSAIGPLQGQQRRIEAMAINKPVEPNSEFDRDEVIVCMVLAFCLGNAALAIIYDLMT